jgi:hypothetical protein
MYTPRFETNLHEGVEFTLEEADGDTFRIQLPDGRDCWVPAESVRLLR